MQRNGSGPPPDPFLETFDRNGDGEISKDEIEQASVELRKLDTNGDGIVSREELPGPPRPGERSRSNNGNRGGRSGNRAGSNANAPKGTVLFHDGYETDPRDGGRPVVLIAAGLGVQPQVFRDAFSNVRPARGPGGPTETRAQENKQVLMDALGKHGITNDRLDEVSNYYRYRPQEGELWTHRPAKATAIIRGGKVVEVKLQDPGAGYSSTPRVEVVGYPDAKVEATVNYGRDLRSNGKIATLQLTK